jgi:hypothetical protein
LLLICFVVASPSFSYYCPVGGCGGGLPYSGYLVWDLSLLSVNASVYVPAFLLVSSVAFCWFDGFVLLVVIADSNNGTDYVIQDSVNRWLANICGYTVFTCPQATVPGYAILQDRLGANCIILGTSINEQSWGLLDTTAPQNGVQFSVIDGDYSGCPTPPSPPFNRRQVLMQFSCLPNVPVALYQVSVDNNNACRYTFLFEGQGFHTLSLFFSHLSLFASSFLLASSPLFFTSSFAFFLCSSPVQVLVLCSTLIRFLHLLLLLHQPLYQADPSSSSCMLRFSSLRFSFVPFLTLRSLCLAFSYYCSFIWLLARSSTSTSGIARAAISFRIARVGALAVAMWRLGAA